MKTQTKVTNVKMKITVGENYMPKEMPVVEGKLVFIETNQHGGRLSWNPLNQWSTNILLGIPYDPIIISDTEIQEVDDWVTDFKNIAQVNVLTIDDPNKIHHRKILALPKHFSPEQLQMIVDGKLKAADKVLVECEEIAYTPEQYRKYGERFGNKIYETKLNSEGHITFHNIEEIGYINIYKSEKNDSRLVTGDIVHLSYKEAEDYICPLKYLKHLGIVEIKLPDLK